MLSLTVVGMKGAHPSLGLLPRVECPLVALLAAALPEFHLEFLRVTTLAMVASLRNMDIRNPHCLVCTPALSLFVASMFVLTPFVSRHIALRVAGIYSDLSDYEEVDDFEQSTEDYYWMYFPGTGMAEEVRAQKGAERDAFVHGWLAMCS